MTTFPVTMSIADSCLVFFSMVIGFLRESEILIKKSATVALAAKQIRVIEQPYYRWRIELGGD